MAAQPISISFEGEKGLESRQVASASGSSSASVDSAQALVFEEATFAANPFVDPKVAQYYRGIYDGSQYECRHVFDPELEWSEREERALVRKLDWHVTTWACIMFFALNLDRYNLKQAISDDLLNELHLTTNDYNLGNTIFYIAFLCAELPSQLISKRVGPDRWIPTQMVLWSIVATSQAALSGKSSFYVCRFLLGALEGGFIPDLVLWMSYFYKSGELPLRLSFFWVGQNLTAVVASFLAYGLLHLRGVAGLSGWRWLFLIEGLITLVIGAASFFLMPASAVQTKAWFRPNGWFTDRQVGIVVNRVLRDDPSKGDMHNREGITPRKLWQAVMDWDLWPIYLIGLVVFIPESTPTLYVTLSLRALNFSTFQTNILSIPFQVMGCFTLIGITWLSEKLNERSLVSMIQSIWLLPCVIALRWWPGAGVDAWGTYGLIVTLLSYPYCHAIVVSWVSRNSGSVRTRSVSAALYNMLVQAGNVVSSNIYRSSDKPLYHTGNSVLVALDILAICLFLGTKVHYVYRNKSRAIVWDAMSEEEREEYINTTKDEGNKRLDFRFVH